jgi:DNA replication protein DnaC
MGLSLYRLPNEHTWKVTGSPERISGGLSSVYLGLSQPVYWIPGAGVGFNGGWACDTEGVIEELCRICDGSGLRTVERPDGERYVRDCVCRVQRRAARMIARAKIPKRYEHCSLDSFETGFSGATSSLKAAHRNARKFVESYPLDTGGTGLLLTGSIGVGKTHLAVGILQALVAERGATGLFYDYRELLKQVQNSYNQKVQATELEILKPVFEAEVLVLDELGASKPTDWVWDTVAHILNTRYNDRRTTIITTNYANAAPLGGDQGPSAFAQARNAVREETLGDRIGERMRSRLQEMCVVVEMHGVDFRQTVNLARFG